MTGFCAYMLTLLQSLTRPAAQDIANMLWAAAQLNHAPSHDVVAGMFDYLVALYQLTRDQQLFLSLC